MELDDLRRQWQQSSGLPQPLVEVAPLLTRRSTNLVEKMRRNALIESGLTVITTLAILFTPLHTALPPALLKSWRVLLALLLVVLLYYYYRKLNLLRRMVQPEVQVRAHLATLCAGLRQLLRFYYWLSVWMLPFVVALTMGFAVGNGLARGSLLHWSQFKVFVVALVGAGALAQVAVVYATRWWVQRLYGQHLDRLEGQLRELEEAAPPTAAH